MNINEVHLGPNPTEEEKMWKIVLETQQFSALALKKLVQMERDPDRRQIFKNAASKFFEAVEELEKLSK